MKSKYFRTVQVGLAVSPAQFRTLRSTIEMEVDRARDNAGYIGPAEDELENQQTMSDLLDILLQLKDVEVKEESHA